MQVRTDRPVPRTHGILLLDLIVAILVLTVAFLLALGMIPFSMRATEESGLHSIGLHLAEQEMERVVYAGYNQAHSYHVNSSFSESTSGEQQTVAFTTTVTVQSLATYANAMYQVDVSCSWTYSSNTRTENLETMIYHP